MDYGTSLRADGDGERKIDGSESQAGTEPGTAQRWRRPLSAHRTDRKKGLDLQVSPRQRHRECRKLLAEGKDPIEERRTLRAEHLVKRATAMTLRACAKAYIAAH